MAHFHPRSSVFGIALNDAAEGEMVSASLVGIQDANNYASVSTWADAINDAISEIEATRARPCECYHCGARRWVAGRCYYCETEREGASPVAPGRPVHG